MPIRTVSSRDFTRDIAAAKRAAAHGPVLITDRGQPAYALLAIEDYYRLSSGHSEQTLLEMMDSIPGGEGADFEPQRVDIGLQVPDLD